MGLSFELRRRVVKKEKEKKDQKKAKYAKPLLTKHQKLKDVTAALSTDHLVPGLGCTRL